MVRGCAVKFCPSSRADKFNLFEVKDIWHNLNPSGWKKHTKKYICNVHFRPEDICDKGKKCFVKPGRYPQIFGGDVLMQRYAKLN
jgi:hypothetical protein